MQSKATTVKDYLAELSADRREAIEAVRAVILKNLDKPFEEGMQYGMIGYYVPHRLFPAGYHCDPRQPLPYAHLAAQKNHMALYLMAVYGDPKLAAWFTAAWKKSGKKLDMGKACIRFRKAEDLALDVIGETFRRATCAMYVGRYEALLASQSSRRPKSEAAAKAKVGTTAAGKPASKKAASKKAASKKTTSATPARTKATSENAAARRSGSTRG